jgi:hypothetical protein
MTERNPFEILLRSNPVDRDRLPEVSESAHGRALLEEIIDMAQPTTTTPPMPAPPPSLRRSRRSRLFPVAVAAAALSLGFTVYAINRDVTEPAGIGCYAEADIGAKTVVVGADGQAPVAVCGAVWAAGAFGREETPPLAACVLSTGAVAVFPGGPDTCGALDLAPLDDAVYSSQVGGFIALRTALVDRFRAAGCLDEQAALDAVREELAARALSDWSVATKGSFSSARPCASLAFEAEERQVSLVPIPQSPR